MIKIMNKISCLFSLFKCHLIIARASLAIAVLMLAATIGMMQPVMAHDHTRAATDHIATMIHSANSLLQADSGDLETRTTEVTRLMDRYFDFPSITRFSAGQYWRSATDEQKREYEAVIREVIIGTVVRNFDKLSGFEYSHGSSLAKGEKLVLVSGKFTDMTGTRPLVSVNWRGTTLPNKPPKVLDIEIENISMLVTQKQENIAVIRKNKGDFGSLIKAMQEKMAK